MVARNSIAGRVGLPALAWGLAFHGAAIAILFGGLGLAAGTVRAVASWKEITLLALVAITVVRAAAGRGPRVTLVITDAFVAGLIALGAVFWVAGETWFRLDVTTAGAAYGFRDLILFMFLYFVGRSTPEVAENQRTLKLLYALALVVTVIAVLEWLFITPEQLTLLGISAYFQDFLGLSAFTTGNDYGLPHSYWTRIGGREVQRAGSVFLSGQGMAVPFLLLLPAATGWLVCRAQRLGRIGVLTWIGYGIIWCGFLLTLTRMTTLAVFGASVVFLLLLRAPIRIVAAGAVGAAVVVVAVAVVPGLGVFIWETLTWQTGSSRTHLADWAIGYTSFAEQPFGSGLGSTGLGALRSGQRPLAIDNQYLEYAVSLGLAGLLLLLGTFTAVVRSGFRLARHASDPQTRAMGMVMVTATVGVLLNGITASVFYAPFLAYIYFWLAGAVTTAAQRVNELVEAADGAAPR